MWLGTQQQLSNPRDDWLFDEWADKCDFCSVAAITTLQMLPNEMLLYSVYLNTSFFLEAFTKPAGKWLKIKYLKLISA